MVVSEGEAKMSASEPDLSHVDLTPLTGDPGWCAELSPDVMTLLGPKGNSVMTVPREDVAAHVRFARDLRHGRTVTFTVMEGMRPYVFQCDHANLTKLLQWLPQRSPSDVRKEVRQHGVALLLVGILFLLRPADFYWLWGAAFVGLGVVGVAWAKRNIYLVNALFMFIFGIDQIIPRDLAGGANVLPPIAAAVLLCWAVQQFTMLGYNAQIRTARTTGGALPLEGTSPLVKLVGRWTLYSSALLWLYTVGTLFARRTPETAEATTDVALKLSAWADVGALMALAIFATSAGLVLARRARPTYLDAKVVAQVLIVAYVLLLWALILSFNPTNLASIFSPLFSSEGVLVGRPYVWLFAWLSLLPAVLFFNRWFSKTMDRELEELAG
jgi:hypothetical protein